MIRVVLYLDPFGITPQSKWEVLGRIDIANDGEQSDETRGKRGTYDARIYKKRPKVWHRTKIRNYPREAYHPWELVRQILNKAAENNLGHM